MREAPTTLISALLRLRRAREMRADFMRAEREETDDGGVRFLSRLQRKPRWDGTE